MVTFKSKIPANANESFIRIDDAVEDVSRIKCVELFAGCGAMAYGLAQAGLEHTQMIELNAAACQTLRSNFSAQKSGKPLVLETDIRSVDWTGIVDVDIVAGGPPCQPFSRGGLSAGQADSRDMWPEAIRAVHDLKPRAFVFENVKGLLRASFADYLSGVVRSLERGGEVDASCPPLYEVTVLSLNAADYGAAQRRERVLIAGVRKDCGSLFPFPEPTHSVRRLAWEKWVSGEYWESRDVARPETGPTSRLELSALRELARGGMHEPLELPWRTCRDAFSDLGEPSLEPSTLRHEFRAGAKAYPGHEGSPIDEPAKALKAGVHGVPGGENMLVETAGSVRYFTVREAARLQGLPDSFVPYGLWSQAMRQLGNAVPTQVAEVAGRWIQDCLRYR